MKKLLTLIVLIAAFLRFFQLNTNPPSLTWDEVAWGYNAYSIGLDGRDEFGVFMPFKYIESFGDFKPPVYAYLTVPGVMLFGLNEFTTRIPSALFGTLTVLVSFFLVRNIFPKRKSVALLTAFLLSISPWHIMLSRAAFEANVATFFIVTGVWLYLEAIQKRPMLLPLSVLSFCLSIYTFNSARILAPLLLIFLSLFYLKKLLSEKKALVLAVCVGLIMVLPIFSFLLSPQASLRFKEVNLFTDIEIIKASNQEIENDGNALWSKVLHNRRFAYAREVSKHYFDNLSPGFLFVNGDPNPKFSTGDVGQMYIWELPFLVIGVLFLVKRREGNWWIVPLWLFLSIIPSSVARDTPHALRIEGALPMFQIFTAYGVSEFLLWLKNKRGVARKYSSFILIAIVGALFINVLYFLHGYYFHYPKEQSSAWQYGYKESIKYAKSVENEYDSIQIGNHLGRPYIYTLFYTDYDVHSFRAEAKVTRDVFGFVHVESFGKYKFPENLPDITEENEKILFIDDPKKVPTGAKIIKNFNLLNGEPIMTAYTLWNEK